jgi:hypothetical protein
MQASLLIASSFEPSRIVEGIPEVAGISYDLQRLRVDLKFAHLEILACATFSDIRGFRVLDEGDLTEFWNPDARPDGWLWRITQGGWLDFERTRPTFVSGLGDSCMEFLILGVDDCVSIIALADPSVEIG